MVNSGRATGRRCDDDDEEEEEEETGWDPRVDCCKIRARGRLLFLLPFFLCFFFLLLLLLELYVVDSNDSRRLVEPRCVGECHEDNDETVTTTLSCRCRCCGCSRCTVVPALVVWCPTGKE